VEEVSSFLTVSCFLYLILLVLLQTGQIVLLYLNSPNLTYGNGLVVWLVAEAGVLNLSIGLIQGFYQDRAEDLELFAEIFDCGCCCCCCCCCCCKNEDDWDTDSDCDCDCDCSCYRCDDCEDITEKFIFFIFSFIYAPVMLLMVYPIIFFLYLLKNLGLLCYNGFKRVCCCCCCDENDMPRGFSKSVLKNAILYRLK
jgi:hypothetical protein